MATLFALSLLLFLGWSPAEGQVAMARFNASGVRGYIKFTTVGAGVQIETSLKGLRGSHAWHVHTLPVDQTAGPSVQCLSTMVGPHYDPFGRSVDNPNYGTECTTGTPEMCEVGDLAGKFGRLPSNGTINETDSTGNLTLRGRLSIIGRSIVIHNNVNGNNFECGTIRSMTELQGTPVSLLQASFIQPVAGTIYFRQVYGEEVQMWGKFYWTNDASSSMNHNWHIHMTAPGEEYRQGYCNTSGNIGGHYRPFGNGPPSIDGYNVTCTPDLTSGCEVGDLTGKHATINVAATPIPYSSGSFFYTDNFLNLTGENAVLNRSVAIHEADRGGPVIACAPLVESENITLKQYGFKEITISQGSPFEDTIISSTSSRTSTILQRFSFSPLVRCGTEAPYSPYERVTIPASGVSTPDQYVLGELQTRYSAIGNTATQRVFDLPVYGAAVSISSRSLRTERENSGTNCSALIPMLRGPNTIVARASFSRIIDGAMYFIQEDNGYGQLGNTHIIVDVFYSDSTRASTMNHNWHVHMNPAVINSACTSAVIGGHYNPFNVSLGNTGSATSPSVYSNYSTDCDPSYQLRCESGDLAGKHGQLDFQPDGPNRPFYTYVDSNLQLTGSFSVVDRSIGLHDITTGLPLFDCGTIDRVYVSAREVVITTSSTDSMLRSDLADALVRGIDMDKSDILILSQRDVSIFQLNCVEIALRTLGTSQAQADSNALLVAAVSNTMTCGACRLASISQITLVFSLLITFLYLGK